MSRVFKKGTCSQENIFSYYCCSIGHSLSCFLQRTQWNLCNQPEDHQVVPIMLIILYKIAFLFRYINIFAKLSLNKKNLFLRLRWIFLAVKKPRPLFYFDITVVLLAKKETREDVERAFTKLLHEEACTCFFMTNLVFLFILSTFCNSRPSTADSMGFENDVVLLFAFMQPFTMFAIMD